MDFQTVPSGQRLRILQLLIAHGKLTGGEMRELDSTLPQGTIFTTLVRLEREGLVASSPVKIAGRRGPPRREYEITGLGIRAARLGKLADMVKAGGPLPDPIG